MLPITLFLFLAYLLLLAYYTYHWERTAPFHPAAAKQQRRFSILIPVRDEEKNIGACLEAIKKQRYPNELIEIIVIDDLSQDQTAAIVRKHPEIKLIQKNIDTDRTGKKASIEMGIRDAQHEWIITTDADCTAGPEWIATINAYLDQQDVHCLVGPVSIELRRKTILQQLQRYDTLMFQGITGAAIRSGAHALGNGANLCYRKESFLEVNGFSTHEDLASGDDVFLIESFMKQFPKHVHFLKSPDAVVHTQAASNWKAFWQQRVRWVSKAHAYRQGALQLAQWSTGIFNLTLLIQSIYCFIQPEEWKATLAIWIFKSMLEWPLVNSVAGCYRERRSLLTYFLLQPIHVIYLVSIGLFGRRKKYNWKGRSVR